MITKTKWLNFSKCFLALFMASVLANGQASNPVPQSLPYLQNFDTPVGFATDPAGFQGFRSGDITPGGTPPYTYSYANTKSVSNKAIGTNSIDSAAVISGASTPSSNNIITSTVSGKQGYNISLSYRTAGFMIGLNTLGYKDMVLSFDVTQLEQDNTITGNAFIDYRVGTTTGFTTLTGVYYSSVGKTVGQVTKMMNITIPSECFNQPNVQLRWFCFPSIEVTNSLSFTFDNISVSGTPLPATKLEIASISPSSVFNLVPNSVIIVSKNNAGIVSPVLTTTYVSLSSSNTALNGTITGTISAGNSSATISGFTFPTALASTNLIVTTTSGDALVAGTLTGIVVNQTSPASKLKISRIVPVSGKTVLPEKPFIIVVEALDNSNGLGLVSQNTTIVLTASGTGTLSVAGSGILTANSSTISITGVYSSLQKDVTISAMATIGDVLSPSTASPAFNVGYVATKFKIVEVAPLGNITVNKPIIVKIVLLDANDSTAFLPENTVFTASVSAGSGILTGTVSETLNAYSSSLEITPLLYSKAESGVKLTISAPGLPSVDTDIFMVKAPKDLAGLTVLYFEDFEKTDPSVKNSTGNPALTNGLKMFSLDMQTAKTSTYPKYKTDAWVIGRVPQEGYFGKGPDLGTNPSFWENTNSTRPDSNYIAYAASWFNDATKDANRWLVTPAITMTGNNFKLSYQAKSSTSTGDYKDKLEVWASSGFNGSSIVIDDWANVSSKNLITGKDSLSHLVSTRVTNFEVTFKADEVADGDIINIAFRLTTKADKGDRVSVDNILVTSGYPTSISETINKNDAKIYPNPATETATLSFNSQTQGAATVTFCSTNGIETTLDLGILNSGPQFVKIPLTSLASGFYIAKIKTPSGVLVTKFIKQ